MEVVCHLSKRGYLLSLNGLPATGQHETTDENYCDNLIKRGEEAWNVKAKKLLEVR